MKLYQVERLNANGVAENIVFVHAHNRLEAFAIEEGFTSDEVNKEVSFDKQTGIVKAPLYSAATWRILLVVQS